MAVPVSADGWGQKSATLVRAGQAVEVNGITLRAIAFYEGDADAMKLTILLSGSGLGSEVLRTRVRLRDGQVHAMTLGGDDERRERFRFERRGTSVDVVFDTVAVERPERTVAAPAALAPVAVLTAALAGAEAGSAADSRVADLTR